MMLCYTGCLHSRVYLNHKCKRSAWKAYMREHCWVYDFEGLRRAYRELFKFWEYERYWESADAFFDAHY